MSLSFYTPATLRPVVKRPRIYFLPIVLLVALSGSAPSARALSSTDRANNRAARQVALQYYQEGNGAQALLYLQANVRADAGVNHDAAVGEELVTIAFILRSERQISASLTAASAALAQLTTAKLAAASAADQANLAVNCGLLCENVLKDTNQAIGLYQSVLAVQPGNPGAVARLGALQIPLVPKP